MYRNVSKYHAKITYLDGIKFHSMREAKRYEELKLLERSGQISNLKLQVPYVIIPKSEYGRDIKYIADFVYSEGFKTIVEDSKGFRTPEYKLKRRLMAEKYGIVIKET